MQRTEAANHFLYQTPPSFSLPPQPHLLLAAAELLLRHKQPWVPSAHVMKPSPPAPAAKLTWARPFTGHFPAAHCCALLPAVPSEPPTAGLRAGQYIHTGVFCLAKERLRFLNLNQLHNCVHTVVQHAGVPHSSLLLKEMPRAQHPASLPKGRSPFPLHMAMCR